MTIEHQDITDPEIHEPKGISSANSGDIYLADGAGSGAWANKSTLFAAPAYGFMSMFKNTTATAIPTAEEFEQFAGSFSPITLFGFTFASNGLVVPTNGVYLTLLNCRLTQDDVTAQEYEIGVSNGAQTATKFVDIDTDEIVDQTFTSILPFTAGQTVQPVVTNTTNANKGLTAINAFLTLVLLRNT